MERSKRDTIEALIENAAAQILPFCIEDLGPTAAGLVTTFVKSELWNLKEGIELTLEGKTEFLELELEEG